MELERRTTAREDGVLLSCLRLQKRKRKPQRLFEGEAKVCYVLGARLTQAGNWLLQESEAGSCSVRWKHVPGDCFSSLFASFPLLQTFSVFHFTPKATNTSAVSETLRVFREWSTIQLQVIASNIERRLNTTPLHTVVLRSAVGNFKLSTFK